MTSLPYLAIDRLAISFGGLKALDGVSVALARGELVGLVGPNGSGKTTLLNILSGYLPPDTGQVRLDGERIDGLRPEALVARGVLRTFQLTRSFARMSVLDNIMVAGCALGMTQEAA